MLLRELRLIIRKCDNNRTFSIISIIGLTVGFVFSILAFLYVQDELKYDKHFTNTGNLYRLTINNDRGGTFHTGQPVIFFDEILQNIPEVHTGTRLSINNHILKIEDYVFNENNFYYVDSNFLQLLGWPLTAGDPQKALTEPLTMIVSERKAKQLFPDKDPIGQSITIDNTGNYTITGIFKDFPEHSHIQSDFFASFITIKRFNPDGYNSWGWHGTDMYLNIQPGSNIEKVNKKIADLWNVKSNDKSCVGNYVKARLQPFSEVYLKSGYLINNLGKLAYLMGFTIIAALILIISCFNFINLYIANKSKTTTETGIKKVLGADKKFFARQVFGEIFFYLLISLGISSLIIYIILPSINVFIGKNLTFSIVGNLPLLLFIILTLLSILFLTGIFPVIHMIFVNTAGVLKGSIIFKTGKKSGNINRDQVKNILVTAQFAISVMLILSSIVINKQLRLIRQHDLGFEKEQILSINNFIGDSENRFLYLKNTLSKYPEVLYISSAHNVPSCRIYNWGGAGVVSEENNSTLFCGYITTNENYLKSIGATIIRGRDFDNSLDSDREKVIINEALAKSLDLKDPIGTKLNNFWDSKEKEIIGVVKNIEYLTIHYPNIPTAFFFKDYRFGNYLGTIVIKLKSADLSKTMSIIQNEWNIISPEYPMDAFFLDEQFNLNYKSEAQTSVIINIMTVVTIILCCLGLFGLATFSINSRIKEIGIRKVNGAKTREILALINRDFIIWIIMAYLIAVPVSSYFLFKWLENFAMKIIFPWWAVLFTGIITFVIAMLTVSFQSFKAALRNPVESLKYE